MEYVLETKQMAFYPKVRIYREYVCKLINDDKLSVRSKCNLFNYIILCSYANYTSSTKCINGKSNLIYPGSWLCKVTELMKWFNLNEKKSIEVLEYLRSIGLIEYEFIYDNQYVFYCIKSWKENNTFCEFNARYPKDEGFFFFSLKELNMFISLNQKYSDKDIIMDLWLNTVYNDESIVASLLAPVTYFRDKTNSPRTTYNLLAKRWHISKAGVCRTLERLGEYGYITYFKFSGRYGTVISVNNYLSIMFNVEDVEIDKNEIAKVLNFEIKDGNEEIIVSNSKLKLTQGNQNVMLKASRVEKKRCEQNFTTIIDTIFRLQHIVFKVLYRQLGKYRNRLDEILRLKIIDSS